MPRGNPDNLRAAAQRKRNQATQRAETALAELVRAGRPVTFRGLAKAAGVSVDFLYNSPLRDRIEQLRATAPITMPAADTDQLTTGDSPVVGALAAQLRELKRRHHEEITELKAALAAAHGENLQLRRALGRPSSAEAASRDLTSFASNRRSAAT
jgi:hypothetical protein